MIINHNVVFIEWDRIFKDPMTTAAAIDRLVHHSVTEAEPLAFEDQVARVGHPLHFGCAREREAAFTMRRS